MTVINLSVKMKIAYDSTNPTGYFSLGIITGFTEVAYGAIYSPSGTNALAFINYTTNELCVTSSDNINVGERLYISIVGF